MGQILHGSATTTHAVRAAIPARRRNWESAAFAAALFLHHDGGKQVSIF